MVSFTYIALALSNSAHGGEECDRDCIIIVPTVICGTFGLIALCVCCCYAYHHHKRRRSAIEAEVLRIRRKQSMLTVISENPELIDIPDRTIPEYLTQKHPNLTNNDVSYVIQLVAKKRYEIV